MRISASAISEDRKKQIVMIAFGMIAAGYIYFVFFRDSAPPAVPPAPVIAAAPSSAPAAVPQSSRAVRGLAGKASGTTSEALDPTLHMEAMLVTESVGYEGSGRNIFSATSAPVAVAIPKPVAPARVIGQVISKATTPLPPQTCPPTCPPVDLKFIGFFLSPSTGAKQVILLHGDDVLLASVGDVVQRRYKLVSVAANSVQIEDMPNNNTQMLPLLTR